MKKILSIFLIIAVLCVFAGCNESGSASSQIAENDTSSIASVNNESKNKNPLTGESNLADSAVNKRPLAVMINNIKISLPQRGIGDADMYYEVLVEGGITRIMAMFSDINNIKDLGSIRSARSYFVELAASHNAIFSHCGGSDAAYSTIKQKNIDNIDFIKGGMYRDQERLNKRIPTEHTAFTNLKLINSSLSAYKYETSAKINDFYRFGDNSKQLENAETAANITAPFSSGAKSTFTYDSASGLYKKGQFGGDHIDGATGEVLTVKNVFILKTEITNTGDYKNHINVDLTSGEGYYACDGKIIPIKWQKNGFDKQLKYYTMDNNELYVAEGKSWVCIIPDKNTVSYN